MRAGGGKGSRCPRPLNPPCSDALYRAVLFAVVTLQTIALEFLPVVGRPLSFLLWRYAARCCSSAHSPSEAMGAPQHPICVQQL